MTPRRRHEKASPPGLPSPAGNRRRFAVSRPTRFGSAVLLWEERRERPRIARVALPDPKQAEFDNARSCPGNTDASCPEVDAIADRIQAFLEGADVQFDLDSVLLENCGAFQCDVLVAESAIPRGRISTYRLIAAHLGRPAAARAVGNALARNPFPIIVPCHRATRSDGTLGGYQGGLAMKRVLLETEGVRFDARGRVAGPSGPWYA